MSEPEEYIPYGGTVRRPSTDRTVEFHDCLFCGAYVNTECARCGELIMSMTPDNDAFNTLAEVCYKCHLELTGLTA